MGERTRGLDYDPIEPGDKGGVEGNWLAVRPPEQLQPGDLLRIERAAEVGQLLRGSIPQQRVPIATDGLSRRQRSGRRSGRNEACADPLSVDPASGPRQSRICSGAASAPCAPPRGCDRGRRRSACH